MGPPSKAKDKLEKSSEGSWRGPESSGGKVVGTRSRLHRESFCRDELEIHNYDNVRSVLFDSSYLIWSQRAMDGPVRAPGSNEFSVDEFRLIPTRPEDVEPVTGFLTTAFHAPRTARFVSPGIFLWKYFAKRPDWNMPRSYLLREDSSIVAHMGVWPVRICSPSGQRAGFQALDWVASPQHPGAGSRLRLALEELADFSIGIGGTDAAQQARSKLGFRPWGTMSIFLRVLRPWLKHRTATAGSGFRQFGQLGRDLFHAVNPLARAGSGLSAHAVESFDESLDKVLSWAEPGEVRSYRTAAALNYLLSCPDTNSCGVVFRRGGSLWGYALLTRVGGQARIAALWVRDDWKSAYQLATEIASRDRSVFEVIAGVSSSSEEIALKQSGYRVRNTLPIAIKDTHKVIPSGVTPCVQLADTDVFFL